MRAGRVTRTSRLAGRRPTLRRAIRSSRLAGRPPTPGRGRRAALGGHMVSMLATRAHGARTRAGAGRRHAWRWSDAPNVLQPRSSRQRHKALGRSPASPPASAASTVAPGPPTTGRSRPASSSPPASCRPNCTTGSPARARAGPALRRSSACAHDPAPATGCGKCSADVSPHAADRRSYSRPDPRRPRARRWPRWRRVAPQYAGTPVVNRGRTRPMAPSVPAAGRCRLAPAAYFPGACGPRARAS